MKFIYSGEIIDYEKALELQRTHTAQGDVGWLIFRTRPVITLGLRSDSSHIQCSPESLRKQNIKVLPVNRGGQATYHGPEQILGFPLGSLEHHTGGDARGAKKFFSALELALKHFIETELGGRRLSDGLTVECGVGERRAGLWIVDKEGVSRKIASFGMRFSRDSIAHGFALNLLPVQHRFSLITACGEARPQVASMFSEAVSELEIQLFCQRLENCLNDLYRQTETLRLAKIPVCSPGKTAPRRT